MQKKAEMQKKLQKKAGGVYVFFEGQIKKY